MIREALHVFRPTPTHVAVFVAAGVVGAAIPFACFFAPDLRGRCPRLVTVPSLARRNRAR